MPIAPYATAALAAFGGHQANIKLTAKLGPFGLAFPAEPSATATLSCDPARGRPYVTGLGVTRMHAPMGGRDAYEFRLQCGAHSTAWSELGPSPLLWGYAEKANAECQRPQSASGLIVTRGRVEGGRQDHFGFTLLCGTDDALAEVDMAASRAVGEVERGGVLLARVVSLEQKRGDGVVARHRFVKRLDAEFALQAIRGGRRRLGGSRVFHGSFVVCDQRRAHRGRRRERPTLRRGAEPDGAAGPLGGHVVVHDAERVPHGVLHQALALRKRKRARIESEESGY